MIATLKTINIGLRFGLEVALLTVLAVYCWRTIPPGAARLAATVAVPLAVMTVWATVVHGATIPSGVQLATQVALFALAAAAIAAQRRPELAALFLSVVAANAALMVVWGQ